MWILTLKYQRFLFKRLDIPFSVQKEGKILLHTLQVEGVDILCLLEVKIIV